MPHDALASLSAAAVAVGGGLLGFLLWFVIWVPLIAFLEYLAHRWIMHRANRLLDPHLTYLKDHGSHHRGDNSGYYVDMPVKICMYFLAPFLIVLAAWGLLVGPLTSVLIPFAALLAWGFVYSYLWTRIHRAIHGTEQSWVQRTGWVFRFYRDHHLRHHAHARINYGTVFPLTDYVFFTWFERKKVT